MLRHEVAEFRRLHAAVATRRRLTPEEVAEYTSLSARLFQRVLAAQNDTLTPRQRPRGSVRMRRALQVELTWGGEQQRAVTIDVGSGGFAALLAASPPRSAAVTVRLHLSREPLMLQARVVDARQRHGTARVSFAFSGLGDSERATLERWFVVDAIGDDRPPQRLAP